jgi:Zn-finger nucleic acid-binding protein
MKLCPICGVELRPRAVYEIEVDTCPKCGGVWLDGGEIQKLIAKIREYREEYYSDERYREWGGGVRKRRRKAFSIFLTRYLTETPRSFTAEDAVDAAPRGGPAGRSRS